MMPLKLAAIVCAHNEERFLGPCLHSLFAQTRVPDEVIVVDNASTDATRAVASEFRRVRIVDAPAKGLTRAREAGRRATTADVLLYLDADCRAPVRWVERHERRFLRRPGLVALTGPYRYYDWDATGRALLRAYDLALAPATQVLVRRVLRLGCIFYGGNFSVRRAALERVGGFDTSIAFHGEDTNIGRRLAAVGPVHLANDCWIDTSARRYLALGRGRVFRLYVRNFVSELIRHRPKDDDYVDVRL